MPPREPARPRVLVAEDDPAILELVATRLDLAGFQVTYARDGAEALEQLERVRPAVVLLDVNMPRLDGFEVLRAIRARPSSASTPVLMLTARHAAADVRQARALGADDYVAKPFDDTKLIARVARLAALRRSPSASAAAPSSASGATDAFLV